MEKLEIWIFLKSANNRSSVGEDFENLYLDSSIIKVSFFNFYPYFVALLFRDSKTYNIFFITIKGRYYFMENSNRLTWTMIISRALYFGSKWIW